MSLYGRLRRRVGSDFGYSSTAMEVSEGVELTGRRFVLTGCSSGLGQETQRVLQHRGATVVGLARSEDKAKASGADEAVACELSEPESVRACVEVLRGGPPIDGIIANAGIMALPELQQRYGLELQLLTNHVGHFILITGLLDRLSETARVVVVSSRAHTMAPKEGIPFDNLSGERSYQPWVAYGVSKLANVLFARELARRLPEGQVANALHPGVIQTHLIRHLPWWQSTVFRAAGPLFLKSIPEGAATQTWAAAHPDTSSITGEYLQDCDVGTSSPAGQDLELAARLWETTEGIVAEL